MNRRTGIPSQEDLEKVTPSKDRLEKGPCVVVECFEKIPCNPCTGACLQDAIRIEGNINNTPIVDFEKCTGCSLCISCCPGLAIFVVDKSKGLVILPYEFSPLPKQGDIVEGLSRNGEKICDAKVVRVLLTKKQDRTAIITIQVPKDLVMEIRNIRLPQVREIIIQQKNAG